MNRPSPPRLSYLPTSHLATSHLADWSRLAARHTKALIALLVMTSLTGCLAPKAPLEIEKPRKFSATSRLKNVTLLPFEGRRSKQTTADIRKMFERTKVRGKHYFTIVDGRHLANVRKELSRVKKGQFKRSDLARIQEQSGAQAIVNGRIVEASIKDTKFREFRDQCAAKENTWRGVMLQKCEEGMLKKVEMACVKRDARFSLQPKMLSLESGRVVFTDRYTRTKSVTHCEDEFGSIEDADDLIDELVELVISDIQDDLTPEISIVKVPIRKLENDSGASEAQIEAFEAAIDFAKSDRFDRACEIWKGLRRNGVNGVATQYNLALCAESKGKLDDALAILTKTDRMLQRPDEQVNRYLHRLRDRIALRDESARSYRNVMSKHRSSSSPAPAKTRELQIAQSQLNSLGYDCGSADGMMGPKTKQCLARYQKKHRLKITGGLSSQILQELGISSKSTPPARVSR
jgi:hypothetical protein